MVVSRKLRLKLRHTSGGKFEFWPVFLERRPKRRLFGPPTRRNGLWEPISSGYDSLGIASALFHPFLCYTHPLSERDRARAGPWTPVSDFVLLDRPKSHEISMVTPIRTSDSMELRPWISGRI